MKTWQTADGPGGVGDGRVRRLAGHRGGQQKTPATQQATADALLGSRAVPGADRREARSRHCHLPEGAGGGRRHARAEGARAVPHRRLLRAPGARGGAEGVRGGRRQLRRPGRAGGRGQGAPGGAGGAGRREPADRLLRQIWTTSREVSTWSQISPDGRSIVGVDDDTGDLATRSVATGQIRRLDR